MILSKGPHVLPPRKITRHSDRRCVGHPEHRVRSIPEFRSESGNFAFAQNGTTLFTDGSNVAGWNATSFRIARSQTLYVSLTITALGAVTGVLVLVQVGGMVIGHERHLPALDYERKRKRVVIPSSFRWNPKAQRWQNEKGRFVKTPA